MFLSQWPTHSSTTIHGRLRHSACPDWKSRTQMLRTLVYRLWMTLNVSGSLAELLDFNCGSKVCGYGTQAQRGQDKARFEQVPILDESGSILRLPGLLSCHSLTLKGRNTLAVLLYLIPCFTIWEGKRDRQPIAIPVMLPLRNARRQHPFTELSGSWIE